jgi:uncharacterized surface protein with fasciclin (FAS1) repeats
MTVNQPHFLKGVMMKNFLIIAVGLISALLIGACAENATEPTATEPTAYALTTQSAFAAPQLALKKGDDPIALIAINAGFDELVAALGYVDEELETGLVDLFLNGKDQYTVFAPTDQAFEDLYALLSSVLETEIDEITDLPAAIVLDVLLYHVTDGRRAANSVVPKKNERTITSLLEETFAVRPDLTIRDGLTGLRDDAMIDTPNISASNGIIHVITQVIVPPSVVAAITG